MKIRQKLQIAFISASTILLLSVAIGVYFFMSQSIEKYEGKRIKEGVHSVAKELDDFMQEKLRDFRLLSKHPLFRTQSNEAISDYLASLVSTYTIYENFFYVDKKGGIYSSSSRTFVGKNILKIRPSIEESFFNSVYGKQGDVFITNKPRIVEKENNYTSSLDFSITVFDAKANTIGYLVGCVDVAEFRSLFLGGNQYGDFGEKKYLLNDRGEMLSSNSKIISSSLTHPDMILKNFRKKNEKGYHIYENFHGRKVISAYVDLPHYGTKRGVKWSLLITTPYSEVMKSISAIFLKISAIFVTIMLIFIIFIIYFSAKLTQPITLLGSAISDFNINEAPIKLEKRGNNDEIAYLYDAYNKMTKSLYESNLIETKLEKENKFLEANLSHFIESANALIFGIDSKGIINEWNLVSEKITGYKKEEVLGKDVLAVFVPQDKSWYVRKTMSNVLNGKESSDFEFPMVSKEGKVVLLLLNLIGCRDVNHEVIGVIGIGQDITDRKNREEQFRLVVDSAPNAIVLVNFSGNIALVNKQTEKQFGYTSEELIGKEMEILIPSHYKKMHPNSRTKFHDDPKSRVMGVGRELYVLRKDGTEFPVEIGLSPIETPEETLVMVSIIDITVRKEYEKTLRNKERRAEELLHAKEKIAIQKKTLKKEKELRLLKSKFVSIASHEFRTPLSAINFAAGSIKRYWDKMEPNMIEKKLSKIEDQVLHMTNLLDDMITVGQAEAGKIRNKPLIVNLGDFIIDIIDEVYRSYQKSHKIMLIDNEELKNSDIFIDRKVGRNIFINLLSNAIKYSPGAEKVTVELSSEKNRIIISVRDYGMGIPESEIENIFKPFIRGNKVDLIQGTGLGLSIVKDALDVLKGEILVESNLGEGSTFIVKIPKKNK